ncbi:MAG TPA: T9SS type A sorting domain-containing protein [Bacteroidaceae bacterium]|nr:T9SS type A sorting domain-containing protein [Bacteroidaceae bacterium]
MRRLYSTVLIVFVAFMAGRAQVVTTEPAFPTKEDAVTVYFDATQGNQGMMDYTGDVYAHTGVLTTESTAGNDWKYVKTKWGENTPETKLTRVSANLYSLAIAPSIREFYGVPETDTITHMAYVFRSPDNAYTGRDVGGADIFVEVYGEGLNINIVSPSATVTIVKQNDPLDFLAISNNADTMALFVDGVFIKGVGATGELSQPLPTDQLGEKKVVIWAANTEEEKRDSVVYFVRGDPVTKALPDNIRDGINYISDTSAILSFFAPGKTFVFAIGDFSDWYPMETFFMKKTPDGERFWTEITNLEPGKIYRYYYYVEGPGTLPSFNRYSDPYSDILLDPSSHKYISETTYPGITGLISGLEGIQYSVIQTGQTPFQWKVNDFNPPEKTDLVIYELLLRDFLAAHDWKTLADTLDYLEELGINAIELMPFNEFSGNESWGYNPIHYFAPDMYYGPGDDLKMFVDECHSRGIAVIQDVVFNHVDKPSTIASLYFDENEYPSSDNPWLNEDFDPDDPNGWYQCRHPYSVFFDFDHSSIHTQRFMDRNLRHWMESYRIDGFRFDLTKGFTQKSTYLGTDAFGNAQYDESEASAYDSERISYLKRMADSIWAFKENAYVILEHFCDNSEEKELANYGMMIWGNSNYNYRKAVAGYNNSGESNFSWISHKVRGWDNPHLVGYMESHDEERLIVEALTYGRSSGDYTIRDMNTALKRVELAATFFFTIPGPKMIWQFGELGYNYSIDYNCRVCNKPIRWDYYNNGRRKRLCQVFSALIHLRISEPAFKTDDFTLNVSGAVKRIELTHEDMNVRIIGNFDVISLDADPNFSKTGKWYEYFSGDSLTVTNVNGPLSLNPGEYRLYTTKKLGDPGITADIPDREPYTEHWNVYPNPVREILYFDNLYADAEITVTDIFGKVVKSARAGTVADGFDMSDIGPGIYVVTLKTRDYKSVQAKVLKIND